MRGEDQCGVVEAVKPRRDEISRLDGHVQLAARDDHVAWQQVEASKSGHAHVRTLRDRRQ
jgi:hypothetical protein